MRWADGPARIGDIRIAYKILLRKPEMEETTFSHRRTSEDDIKVGLKEKWFEYVNWIQLETNIVQWRPVANAIRNLERRGNP
jgi:hypothetical protein